MSATAGVVGDDEVVGAAGVAAGGGSVLSPAELSREVENLKAYLSNLYVPKHMDSMLKKVGHIEWGVQRAQESMSTCYHITLFLVFLFVLILLGLVYVMWRFNYFKFLCRQNRFGRYQKPRTCYACYRPWRGRASRQAEPKKGHFSAPELRHESREEVPSLEVVREADLTASSSSSSSSSSSASCA